MLTHVLSQLGNDVCLAAISGIFFMLKKETEKEKKKRKKKEQRKGEKERETLFQLSSISSSRPRRRLTRVARALTKESIFYLHSSHLSMVRSSVACSASESFDSAPLS